MKKNIVKIKLRVPTSSALSVYLKALVILEYNQHERLELQHQFLSSISTSRYGLEKIRALSMMMSERDDVTTPTSLNALREK